MIEKRRGLVANLGIVEVPRTVAPQQLAIRTGNNRKLQAGNLVAASLGDAWLNIVCAVNAYAPAPPLTMLAFSTERV
jgi:hypothetical protein